MNAALVFRLVLLAALALPAQAAVVLRVSQGNLLGASGVLIGGKTYDVTFSVASCVDLFMGCDEPTEDFAFLNITDGATASQALLDQVLVDGAPEGDFNSMLDRVPGCTSPAAICRILTPYGFNALAPTTIDTYTAVQLYQFSFFDTIAPQAFISPEQVHIYAVWSLTGSGPVVTPVSEPGTLGLLAAALGAWLFGSMAVARQREGRPSPDE